MLNDNILTQIELYVNNELNGDALIAFENEMALNPEIRLEVSIVQDLAEGIRRHGELKDRLKRIDRQTAAEQESSEKEIKQSTGKIKRLYFTIAAAAAILLAVFALFNFPSTSLSSEELFAMHYEAPSYGSRNIETDKILQNASNAYITGDYEKALGFFNQMTSQSSINLYRGVSFLELQRYDEAIAVFNKVIANDREDSSDALWYKALTQLKKDDQEGMKRTLNQLIKDNRASKSLREKAESLL